MIKVALTGNRYAGKDTVANAFVNRGIPVFHADPIIKFILNYRTDIEPFIKKEKLLGDKIFVQGFIDPDRIRTPQQFEKLLEIIEFDLFTAYDRWSDKFKKTKSYTIFHSSILFEKEWNKYFDKTINVFTPREDRTMRIRLETDIPLSQIHNLLDSEIDEFKKNGLSSYVIHSYRNIENQVAECHKMICNEFKKEVDKNDVKFKGFVM